MAALTICLIIFAGASLAGINGQKPYPVVQAFSRTFDVPDVDKADLVAFIKSGQGRPVYKLQCHSAFFSGDPDFEYGGDFECRLSSIAGGDEYSTLLTEDVNQSRDWESRGRFFVSELQDECAHIPDFGASRRFRLRGMELTLEISEPIIAEDKNLRSLKLTVRVRPDATAQRPIAEAVPFPRTNVPQGCMLSTNFADQTAH
jgi:hypothetical protein